MTIGNLIHETSTTTGTGNLTIAKINGKRRLSDQFTTGGSNKFYYFAYQSYDRGTQPDEWEYGTGSLVDANTLKRDTVIASSNSGSLVSFTAGTKEIVNDIPAASQLILTGLLGGQTIAGGTAASDNLTLSSTSNATKGKIVLGSASAYDEANDRLGLGTTSPSHKIDISQSLTGSSTTAAINIASTWNVGSATPTAIKLNITNTASGSGSLLMDLQVGGSTKFCVGSNGNVGIGAVPSSSLNLMILSASSSSYISMRGSGSGSFGFTYGVPSTGNAELWNYDNGYLRFATNGSEYMRITSAGSVGIGTTTPNANAILDLSSTTKPFMPPRMTTTQRDAVSSPTAGMVIYNTSTNKLNVYTTAWEAVTSA